MVVGKTLPVSAPPMKLKNCHDAFKDELSPGPGLGAKEPLENPGAKLKL